jgi:hypothetical protein
MSKNPKANAETSEQFHKRIRRRIEAIEAKKFRCPNPSSIEVFDFDKKWDLVLPHLHDSIVERVLAESMSQCERPIAAVGTIRPRRWRKYDCSYDPARGPWAESRTDYWAVELDRRAEKATPGFVWKNDDDPTEEEWEEYQQFRAQFEPKPDTVDWYTSIGHCHWLAPWLREIGQRVYPQYRCRIMAGDDHSLAYSTDRPGNIRLIFDILNFREMTAIELIEFATRKNTEPETESTLSC